MDHLCFIITRYLNQNDKQGAFIVLMVELNWNSYIFLKVHVVLMAVNSTYWILFFICMHSITGSRIDYGYCILVYFNVVREHDIEKLCAILHISYMNLGFTKPFHE